MRDLRRVRVEDDRAVHLRHLVEERRRVVDLELDAAGEQEAQVLRLADHDQPAGARVQDVVDALAQRGAWRDHLQCLHQPRLRPYFSCRTLRRIAAPQSPILGHLAILQRLTTARTGCSADVGRRRSTPASASRRSAASGERRARRAASPPRTRRAPLSTGAITSLSPYFARLGQAPLGVPDPAQLAGQPELAEAGQRRPVAARSGDARGCALATASATARSQPGSSTRTPPTTLTNTSAAARADAARGGRGPPARAPGGCGRGRRRPAAAARAPTARPAPAPRRAAAASPPSPPARRSRARAWPRRRSAPRRRAPRPGRPGASRTRPASLVEPKRFFSARSVAVGALALALELQHAVDEVLEHARARPARPPWSRGRRGSPRCRAPWPARMISPGDLAHLADRAGRAGQLAGVQRLHRVDHAHRRAARRRSSSSTVSRSVSASDRHAASAAVAGRGARRAAGPARPTPRR